MSNLLTSAFLATFVVGCIMGAMPLMLAAVGETIGEAAGVLNLGIEGVMLVGAYVGYVVALDSHSLWLGMLAGAIGGAVMSLVMLVLNVWFGLNQIVIGIAVSLAGTGITSVLYLELYGAKSPRVPAPAEWIMPGLSHIPVIGGSLFSQPFIFWASILLIVGAAWAMKKTNWSLSIRAAGQTPASLDAAGGSVMRTRSQAVLIGGAFAGIGGAYLSLIATGAFTPVITNGIGYVAIIVTMVTNGRIVWVAAMSLLFGFSVSLGTVLQLTGLNISTDLIGMLPYVVVMIVLLIFARGIYISSALAAPYTRGAR